MFKINDLVHSALYKFGRVTDIFELVSSSLGYQTWQRVESYNPSEGKNYRVIVSWNKKNYGKSYYDGEGFTLRAERTYPSLQLVDLSLSLPEKYLAGEVMAEEEITEEIKVVEKWQTLKMDEYFKIPKRK